MTQTSALAAPFGIYYGWPSAVNGAAGDPSAAVCGYVAVAAHSVAPVLSLSDMDRMLRAWSALGASGVLLDCAGYDFGVTRERFRAVIALVRAHGLRPLVNAWRPADVLGGATPLREGDGYLGENTVLSRGVWQEPAAYEAKLSSMLFFKRALGIELFEVATTDSVEGRTQMVQRLQRTLEPYEVDCVQLTDPMYSSTTNLLLPPTA
ncbi:MAG: hypothetical protein ACTHMZ_15730 [Actinomycetes bacterium]